MKRKNKDDVYKNLKQINRMRMSHNNMCGGCGYNQALPVHPCPELMNKGDDKTLCSCCSECVRRCQYNVF